MRTYELVTILCFSCTLGCLRTLLAIYLLLHVCKTDYCNATHIGWVHHNTRITVKCNQAHQTHVLKNQQLLEVFSANTGRRGRWKSETNLGAPPVSLQPKDLTSQVIRQQPLYFISTFRPLGIGDGSGNCSGRTSLSAPCLAGEAAVPCSSSDPVPWREEQPFRPLAPLRS